MDGFQGQRSLANDLAVSGRHEVDDGGGLSHPTRAGIQIHRNRDAELIGGLLSRQRGRMSGLVRTRDRHRARHTQQLTGLILVGNAHGEGAVGLPQIHPEGLLSTQDESQTTWPVLLRESLRRDRNVLAQSRQGDRITDEDWRRHVATAFLGVEKTLNGQGIESISTDPINGVGRQDDALAVGDGVSCLFQSLFVGRRIRDVEYERGDPGVLGLGHGLDGLGLTVGVGRLNVSVLRQLIVLDRRLVSLIHVIHPCTVVEP